MLVESVRTAAQIAAYATLGLYALGFIVISAVALAVPAGNLRDEARGHWWDYAKAGAVMIAVFTVLEWMGYL